MAKFEDLLKQLREQYESAQSAINTLVRTQVAQGLAPLFMERWRPYEGSDELVAMMDQGLLNRATFIQKRPEVLHFYQRFLFGLRPERILEIGVKGGGSTTLWKQLFPAATVIGMDLKIKRGLAIDGVVYVQGDQSDAAQLAAIATEHGPFDLVIDDGSHVSDHQITSLRALLGHVRAGGLYVIEDIHTSIKRPEYGADIWPDFLVALFQLLRRGVAASGTVGSDLATELFPQIADLIVSDWVLVLRRSSSKPAV